MKVVESTVVCGYTVIVLDGRLPLTGWRALEIGGERYEPVPVMDMGDDCVAVKGSYALAGQTVRFLP